MSVRAVRSVLSRILSSTGLRPPVFSEIAWRNLKKMTVGPVLMQVNEFDGEFFIDPRSDLFSRLINCGHYEPELANIVRRLASNDGDAVDVGANIGFFTTLMAKSLGNGKVLACEPTTNASRLLRRNLEHNNVANVLVFEGAVSNQIGQTALSYVEGHEEYSSLGTIEHKNAKDWSKKQLIVPSKTLDILVEEFALNPKLIKVDVEGAESLVFEGGLETFRRCRPIIISELDDSLLKNKGASVKSVVDLLASLDYTVVDPYLKQWRHGLLQHHEILAFPSEMKLQPVV